MSPLSDIFPPAYAAINYPAGSKPELIRDLAARLCGALDLDADRCLRALLEREALGSTGIGGGAAIPHARLDALHEPRGLIVRLRRAIDFEAIDGRPVGLVCLLLAPAADAPRSAMALAAVARRLRDPAALKSLRNAVSNAAFREAFLREPAAGRDGAAPPPPG